MMLVMMRSNHDDEDDGNHLSDEEEGEPIGRSVKVHCCLSFNLMKLLITIIIIARVVGNIMMSE